MAAIRKFTLQRERLNSQGYDSCGCYWGVGSPLYWYATDDGEISRHIRARDRKHAKAVVRAMHENMDVRFYR